MQMLLQVLKENTMLDLIGGGVHHVIHSVRVATHQIQAPAEKLPIITYFYFFLSICRENVSLTAELDQKSLELREVKAQKTGRMLLLHIERNYEEVQFV